MVISRWGSQTTVQSERIYLRSGKEAQAVAVADAEADAPQPISNILGKTKDV